MSFSPFLTSSFKSLTLCLLNQGVRELLGIGSVRHPSSMISRDLFDQKKTKGNLVEVAEASEK